MQIIQTAAKMNTVTPAYLIYHPGKYDKLPKKQDFKNLPDPAAYSHSPFPGKYWTMNKLAHSRYSENERSDWFPRINCSDASPILLHHTIMETG